MLQEHAVADDQDRMQTAQQHSSEFGNNQNLSDKLCQYINQKPATSLLLGLGIGLGTGVVVGSLLKGSSSHLTSDEAFAEKIGNRVKDSLSDVIPSSLMKHFKM